MPQPKDYSLEAMRGIAAIIVLLGHILLLFAPATSGYFPDQFGTYGVRVTPLAALFNGTASVVFFFVLSGYVLTRGYFRSRDASVLLRGAIKRWPRLMVPVLLSVLLSYALLTCGWYFAADAGVVSKSPYLLSDAIPTSATLLDALREGTLTFFTGERQLNSALWTMQFEFFGSYIAYAYALASRYRLAWLPALVAGFGLAVLYAPPLCGFFAGVFLAAVLPFDWRPLGGLATAIAAAIAVFLFGHTRAPGLVYGWLAHLPSNGAYIIGACLLISAIELYRGTHRIFDNRVSRYLGEFSFPIYLVQLPALLSAGALTLVWTHSPWLAGAAAAAATIVLAVPVWFVNNYWLGLINGWVTGICVKRFAPPVSRQTSS